MKSLRRHSSLEHSAFTLVEMLLVLVIILIMAAWAFPTVSKQLEEQTFKGEVWAARDRIANGRIEAIISNTPVEFKYGDRKVRWEANGIYAGDHNILVQNDKHSAEITINRITNQIKVSRIWDIK